MGRGQGRRKPVAPTPAAGDVPGAMPKRILHIDSGREWRGGQRQLLLLADGQRVRGLEPLVATPPDGALIARCRDHGVAVAAVRMRSRLDLLAVRKLHALITHWRPDLLHAHDARAIALARAAHWWHPTLPLVVTRRAVEPPHRPRHYQRGVTRIIAISDAVVDGLRRAGIGGDRIARIYPGVAAPQVTAPRDWRRERGWPADSVLLGLLRAGSDAAPQAVAAALAQLPETDRQRARVLLLGGTVVGDTTLGDVPAFTAGHLHEMAAAVAGLDVLVQPVAAEGLGTPVVEALALGVPVVVARSGSLGEVVEDGQQGLIVPADDPTALGEALHRLISDAALRARLAAAGPARAARFDVDRYVDAVDAEYETARRTARSWRGRVR
jgi:L-malate glycosyltransferase